MDTASIVHALQQIPPGTSTPDAIHTGGVAGVGAEADLLESTHRIAELVRAGLEEDPAFVSGRQLMLVNPLSGSGLDAGRIAESLVSFVRGGGSPDEAVEWIQRLLSSQTASGMIIMTLWGVEVESGIDLTPTIRLVPVQDLPRSRELGFLSDLLSQARHLGRTGLRAMPRAALTMRTDGFRPLAYAGTPILPSTPHPMSALDDARLAISSVGPSSPMFAAAWFQYDDADLQRAHIGGLQSTMHEIEPSVFAKSVTIDPQQARDVVPRYLSLAEPLKGRTRLALGRLNQAVRRHNAEDRALELAIVLETILADENPGENTYKLGLRAALLTDGDVDARVERRAIISALYSVRSSVAHNGRMPATVKVRGRGKVRADLVVDQALSAVAQTVTSLILRGELPDWYRYELSPVRTGVESPSGR